MMTPPTRPSPAAAWPARCARGHRSRRDLQRGRQGPPPPRPRHRGVRRPRPAPPPTPLTEPVTQALRSRLDSLDLRHPPRLKVHVVPKEPLMHADRTNRFALALFGLLVLAAGAAGMAASTGVFGAAFSRRTLFDNQASRYIGHHGSWLWPAVAAACLLLALACLRWILALLASTDRAGDITIPGEHRPGHHHRAARCRHRRPHPGNQRLPRRRRGQGPGHRRQPRPRDRAHRHRRHRPPTCTHCTTASRPKPSPTPGKPSASHPCPSRLDLVLGPAAAGS